jgi:phosphatidylinositol alpha-1,6-mannosyltransferase
LIDIWPAVTDAIPTATLVIVGDGNDRRRLERRAVGLGDRVRFLGLVSDEVRERLYDACEFFAMPSRDEGFGLVFLEAMQAGKACIGAVGAASEIIEDGVTGFVVRQERGPLLRAIVRLFQDSADRERMGRAGATRVADRFTEAHFRRRFRDLLGLRPDATSI